MQGIILKTRALLLTVVAITTLSGSLVAGEDKSLPINVPDRALNKQFLEVTQVIPGFGGMFYDRDGVLNVYLLNINDRDKAKAAIIATFGEQQLRGRDIKVIRGSYSFSQLHDWFNKMSDNVLAIAGVVLIDLDEAKNRLRIGVIDKKTRVRVQAELDALSIPQNAAIVEEMSPVRPAETLRDYVRPVVGALQINYSSFLCTLGFNAIGFGGSRGFVTNSHCTDIQGGVENTGYYQPVELDFIGQEIGDPNFFTGFPCPVGRVCRWSDSAFAEYHPSADNTIGLIAQTMSLGSITINPDSPSFFIVWEAPYPTSGQTLDKIGRTTGWTSGTVTGTCVRVNLIDTNITLLCQDMVRGAEPIVDAGDSGSPVFAITATPDEVVLYGVLWGRSDDGLTFFLSAMDNIEFELGNLLTHN